VLSRPRRGRGPTGPPVTRKLRDAKNLQRDVPWKETEQRACEHDAGPYDRRGSHSGAPIVAQALPQTTNVDRSEMTAMDIGKALRLDKARQQCGMKIRKMRRRKSFLPQPLVRPGDSEAIHEGGARPPRGTSHGRSPPRGARGPSRAVVLRANRGC